MPQTPPNQPIPWSYTHIANAGTVVVKASSGSLAALNVNSAVSGATVTLLDQKTTVTGTVEIGALSFGTADVTPLAIPYAPPNGVFFVNGLAIVTTGTVDLTVLSR